MQSYLILADLIKGSLIRDFRVQVFFMNPLPPGHRVYYLGYCKFVRKFAEIFTPLCVTGDETFATISACLHASQREHKTKIIL
jgi:hypothetical protein